MPYPIDYETMVFGDAQLIDIHEKTWSAIRMVRCLESLAHIRGAILELGCGAGRVIRTIEHQRPDLECFGCDISQNATKKASEYGDGVRYIVCDAESLPFGADSFDCLVALDIFEHIADTSQVLKEIHRVLKRGGTLYIHVPCEGNLFTLYSILLLLRIDLTKKVVGHIHHFKTKEFMELLARHKLVVKRHWHSMHLIHQLSDIRNWLYLQHLNRKMHRIESKPDESQVNTGCAVTSSGRPELASPLFLPLKVLKKLAWLSWSLLSTLVVHETILLENVRLTSIGNCLQCVNGE